MNAEVEQRIIEWEVLMAIWRLHTGILFITGELPAMKTVQKDDAVWMLLHVWMFPHAKPFQRVRNAERMSCDGPVFLFNLSI